ncbi:HAUS augmin-like complex subunit 6 isoform X1 [Hydra vulgaris]|uniref:HAUS augmin-like complex subunit 6 isoform X1 n=1 Tax=Hydra vulgaris TaxID=6087 RepID=UPI0032E9C9B0
MSNIKSPDNTDIREIFYSNLLLLGFDAETYEVQYRIPFNRDMFSLPNRKCMEVVVYFLFKKLNKESTLEIFRNCWPIIDKKSEQEFRKQTIDWITRIKKDDPECNLPNITPSLLITPSGEKFYQFLFYFSVYTLKQKAKAISKKDDLLPLWVNLSNVKKKFSLQIQKSLMSVVINRKKRLINYVMETFSAKNIWMEYARDLNKEHNKLLKEIGECEESMKVVKSKMVELFKTSSFSLKDTARNESLEQVKNIWETISKHFEMQKKIQEQIRKTLYAASLSLEGDKINFEIPAILVNDCERMLHYGKRFQNVYKERQLNILSLIELWNLLLQRVRTTLSQNPLYCAVHEESYVCNEVNKHSNYLCYLESIRLRLASNIIPDIQKSIKDLKKSLSDMSSYQESYKYILDLLPTTPAFHFNFNDDNDDTKKLFKDEYTATPSATCTPYAVDDLLCKLNDNSQDQTPVRQLKSIQKKYPYLLSSPTAKSTNLKLDCPAKIGNVKKTQMLNPQANNKSSRIPRYNLSNCNVKNTKDVDCISNIKRKSSVHDIENKSKAQEILLEQIAQSVLNVNKENVGSSSDEEIESSIHGLYNPFEAFSKNPFINNEKCIRTPGPKCRQSNFIGLTCIGLSNLSLLDTANSLNENTDNNDCSSFFALSPIHDFQTSYSPFETSNIQLSKIPSDDYSLLTPFCNLEKSNVPQRSPSSTVSTSQRLLQDKENQKSLNKTFMKSIEELSNSLKFDEGENFSYFEQNTYKRNFVKNNFPEFTPEQIDAKRNFVKNNFPEFPEQIDAKNLISFFTPEKHLGVTNDDVDNFIEEVLSNTPGYLMKTPYTIQNNFHLLTPEKLQ